MYEDSGVEELNQHHVKVPQHKAVEILVDHLVEHKIFQFSEDKASDQSIIDLYRNRLDRLASGSHVRHFKRQALCSRKHHDQEVCNNKILYTPLNFGNKAS